MSAFCENNYLIVENKLNGTKQYGKIKVIIIKVPLLWIFEKIPFMQCVM